ncbi:MAG: hypothetical protein HQK65_19875 [Desulfamplus sp.]|nr:hypothetical protein [Desulfamplus sp.]
MHNGHISISDTTDNEIPRTRNDGDFDIKIKQKDEIIEELWEIKEKFSSKCNKNIRQLVQLVNEIAIQKGFEKTIDKRNSLRAR